MPTPREKTSIVKAPVLFRLPHVHSTPSAKGTVAQSGQNSSNHAASAARTAADRQSAASTIAPGAPWSSQSQQSGFNSEQQRERKDFRVDGDRLSASQSSAAPNSTDRSTAVGGDSFIERWAMEIKRSVILLAAIVVLWGTWNISQKPVAAPDESNLANMSDDEEAGSKVVSAEPTGENNGHLDGLPAEPRVASIMEPASKVTIGSTTGFVPVTEPQSSVDKIDPEQPGESRITEANREVASDFSPSLIESLEPPANESFYGDYESDSLELSIAQKPPVASQPTGDQDQPATASGGDSTRTSATNFVPSATPEMPGFDPAKSPNSGSVPPVNQPVFSATPNGISDWSRYLPGNSGNASIRAVSATQAVGAEGEERPAGKQAIYLDENDGDSADVGVAPFYR